MLVFPAPCAHRLSAGVHPGGRIFGAGINTNIRNVEATVDDQHGRIDMTVEISDVKHLQKVVKALRSVAGVLDVERAAR